MSLQKKYASANVNVVFLSEMAAGRLTEVKPKVEMVPACFSVVLLMNAATSNEQENKKVPLIC